jgi:hypothetical protein
MLKSLASKVGRFITFEGASSVLEGNFYRVRVKLDVIKTSEDCGLHGEG